MTGLCPTDRYVVHRNGTPVYSTNKLQEILLFLWGRQLRFKYVVYDYERPYPFDNPDILTWLKATAIGQIALVPVRVMPEPDSVEIDF